jgi:iron complex transport system ATP-binding protein
MSGTISLLQTKGLQTGYRAGGRAGSRYGGASDGRGSSREGRRDGSGSGSHAIVTIGGPLDLTIQAGQLICLLGPNGSGKSTLLRTLAGLQPPLEGQIEIEGVETGRLTPVQLAKRISLVLTDRVANHNLTVYSLVALGRYPYSGWLGLLSEADKKIIQWAIEVTGIGSFTNRKVYTLSDGETQKVMLARALAQDTPLLLLDEPTAHLDLPSRIQLMRLLHRLARETRKGILLSTHELDLALQVAGEVWLLQPGGQLDSGAPEDLVLNGVFEAAFVKEGIVFDKAAGAFTIHRDNTTPIILTGSGTAILWTQRALQREGFVVSPQGAGHSEGTAVYPEEAGIRTVHLFERDGRPFWRVEGLGEYDSIAALLSALAR